MEKYDLVIVGGGPAGVVSAITARRYYKNKSILLIKDVNRGVVPCGIPYIINTLKSCEENELGYTPLEKKKIDLKTGTVKKIDSDNKKVFVSESEYSYKKLILATGSLPIIPPLKGVEKEGVYPVKKEMDYLKGLRDKIRASKNIILVGGGYIGVEFADEIADMKNKNITLIEMMPRILNNTDPNFSKKIHEKLTEKKVKILTNTKVNEIVGENKVEKVKTDNEEIKADIVILGVGAKANYKIAEQAGLKIEGKSIKVDDFQKTSNEDIFAVGDCAYKKDFITSKQSRALLASSASNEARIAGKNVFNPKIKNMGTIGVYSTKVGDICIGSAGITESIAKKENMEIVTGKGKSPDKHPGKMPGTRTVELKLIFNKSGTLIGGEILGGDSIGEMINIIGTAIQNKMKGEDIEKLEIGTHPKLTPPPTKYPLITAAQDALFKL